MRRRAARLLLALFLAAAMVACSACAAEPLLLRSGGGRRTGRALQAPAGQLKLADLLTEAELPAGRAVHLSDSYYRVTGPQVSSTDQQFVEALHESLVSVYKLIDVTPLVSIQPVASATRKAAVNRRLLQLGANPAAAGVGAEDVQGGPGVLFQDGLAQAPGADRSRFLAAEFGAVIAEVEAYVTRDSVFSRIVQKEILNQHRLLEGSLAAFGFKVSVVSQGFLVPDAGLAVLQRLPPSITQNTQSYMQGIFRFSGAGAVTVAAQSALLAYVDDQLPTFYTSANVTGIAPAANRSHDVAVRFSTGKTLQEFGPQDLRQALAPDLAASMAAAGVPGNVSLLSTRTGKDLDPFAEVQAAIAAGCCTKIITVPIPTFVAGGAGGDSGDSGQLPPGAVAGIVVGAVAAILGMVGLLALWWWRRRQQAAAGAPVRLYSCSTGKDKPSASQLPDQPLTGWAILPEQLEVCLHADGSEWLLGAGASGKVVKALRGGVQDVAVKQLLHTNAAAVEKFLEEVSILRSLNYDRNVVQFYGACLQEGSNPMLVTEYMEGGDLCSAIERDAGGELKWYREGHRIALDIAKGLYFLHSHAVMHGDLKSRNVLLTRARTAKLADIGLARIVDPGSQASSEQWTFAYAAPEVILGQPAGLKSDIFSMGVVLHEVVTGIMPVTRGNLPEPSVPEECPADVLCLIHACTAADPGLRPTAKEVFTVLQRSCETHVPRFRIAAAAAAAANAASNRVAGRGSSERNTGSYGSDLVRQSTSAAALKHPQHGVHSGAHIELQGARASAQQQVMTDGISKHSASSIDMGLAPPELVRQHVNGSAAGAAAGATVPAMDRSLQAAERSLQSQQHAAPENEAKEGLQPEPHQLSFGDGMTPGTSMEYDGALMAEVLAAVNGSGSAEVAEVLAAMKALGSAGTADTLRAAAAAAAVAAVETSSGGGGQSCDAALHRDLRSGSALYGDPVAELPTAGSGELANGFQHPSVRQPSAMGSAMYSRFE